VLCTDRGVRLAHLFSPEATCGVSTKQVEGVRSRKVIAQLFEPDGRIKFLLCPEHGNHFPDDRHAVIGCDGCHLCVADHRSQQ